QVAESVRQAMSCASTDELFVRPGSDEFAASPSISIDYAVMEHSGSVNVVPVSFAWSDVGSWAAVRELSPPDEHGNVLLGDVIARALANSLVRSDANVTVAVVGLDHIVCIVTEDAAFIAPVDRAEEVKQVVEQLRTQGNPRADEPARVYRPWGS